MHSSILLNAAMESGYVDIDSTIAKYKEKIKAASIEKVIKEKQSQLDAYLAANK